MTTAVDQFDATPAKRPFRVVILGGGFGGAYCALRLQKLLSPPAPPAEGAQIILIDRNDYLIFYPLLVEAGTGSLEPRHVVVSLRSFLKQAQFAMGEVTGLDTRQQTVTYRPVGHETERTLAYDHVIVALGSVTKLPPIPGLADHGFQLKTLRDAVGLRDRALALLETANAEEDTNRRRALLHFVVVGANFTGVELAGEFHEFLTSAAKRYPNVGPRDCRITLVEILDRILPALDRELADYATDRLRRRGIDVLLKTSVRHVEADHCVLHDGARLESYTTIWAAGIAPTPIIKSLGLPLDERGYILCDRDLRVSGYANVWAIGDCAVNTDAEGLAYPATAQHAIAEGEHAADNLIAVMRGQTTTPLNFKSKGSIAAIGCRTAVAKVMGLKLSGVAAWFLYRTVYLLRMPGIGRKMRIALDWTLDWFFRKEYVQLGIHRVLRNPAKPAASPPGVPGAKVQDGQEAETSGERVKESEAV